MTKTTTNRTGSLSSLLLVKRPAAISVSRRFHQTSFDQISEIPQILDPNFIVIIYSDKKSICFVIFSIFISICKVNGYIWRLFRHFFFQRETTFADKSRLTGFDVSCKLSPMETICMKCQILFSKFPTLFVNGDIRKTFSLRGSEFFPYE